MDLLGWVLWHINHCWLVNIIYIYIYIYIYLLAHILLITFLNEPEHCFLHTFKSLLYKSQVNIGHLFAHSLKKKKKKKKKKINNTT